MSFLRGSDSTFLTHLSVRRQDTLLGAFNFDTTSQRMKGRNSSTQRRRKEGSTSHQERRGKQHLSSKSEGEKHRSNTNPSRRRERSTGSKEEGWKAAPTQKKQGRQHHPLGRASGYVDSFQAGPRPFWAPPLVMLALFRELSWGLARCPPPLEWCCSPHTQQHHPRGRKGRQHPPPFGWVLPSPSACLRLVRNQKQHRIREERKRQHPKLEELSVVPKRRNKSINQHADVPHASSDNHNYLDILR